MSHLSYYGVSEIFYPMLSVTLNLWFYYVLNYCQSPIFYLAFCLFFVFRYFRGGRQPLCILLYVLSHGNLYIVALLFIFAIILSKVFSFRFIVLILNGAFLLLSPLHSLAHLFPRLLIERTFHIPAYRGSLGIRFIAKFLGSLLGLGT